jgi:hypothetical protein
MFASNNGEKWEILFYLQFLIANKITEDGKTALT